MEVKEKSKKGERQEFAGKNKINGKRSSALPNNPLQYTVSVRGDTQLPLNF